MDSKNGSKPGLIILSLEDNPMDAELIKENLLVSFGPEVQFDLVTNEKEYISALSTEKYDLILSDFQLPGYDGFQALKQAKSMIPSIPFICLSGFIGEELSVELLKQGAIDYVSKANLGRLKLSIERALQELKDQNDLKESLLALTKSQERYKAITETSLDGFVVLDKKGNFLEVNDVFCNMSKYSREALLSMNIKDLALDEQQKQTEEYVQKVIAKGGDQFESRIHKSDGTFFYAYNSITYIPNEKITICFVHDISKRKKAEKDLLYMLEGLSGHSYGNL